MDLHSDGSRRFEPWPCPGCGYVMDAATHVAKDGVHPGDGDLSVCLRCALPFVMAGGRWRELTDDELIGLPHDIKIQLGRVQIAVREFNAQNDGGGNE